MEICLVELGEFWVFVDELGFEELSEPEHWQSAASWKCNAVLYAHIV